MKKRLFAIILILVLGMSVFVACNNSDMDLSGVKIVFELEGGKYNESEQRVTHYIKFEPGTTNLIFELGDIDETDEPPTKTGYVLDGWYRTKTGEGDNVTYDGKWNFAADRVDDNGITLYAKWVLPFEHTYQIWCVDAVTGDVSAEPLYTYTNRAGLTYRDSLKKAEKREGYTMVAGPFSDKECATPWDVTFKHPGGEADLNIPVYYKYIVGEYTLVGTANELVSALGKKENIYVTNDIDMEGKQLPAIDSYSGTFEGNGHTISNFSLSWVNSKDGTTINGAERSLGISIFGNTTNAAIQNVNFVGAKLDINVFNDILENIFVAPITVVAQDTTITNVSVGLTVTVTQLPANLTNSSIVYADSVYLFAADGSGVIDTTGSTATITKPAN